MKENRDSYLLCQYYFKNMFPFESIIKLAKMNRSRVLLQYRDIFLQSKDATKVDRHFNKVCDESLKEKILERNHFTVHIGAFNPISIQSYIMTPNKNNGKPIIQDIHFNNRTSFSSSFTSKTSSTPPTHVEICKTLKEFVIDIDVKDYGRICSCIGCSICDICWLHIEGTSIILKDILINRYGVDENNIMWIFSGGKGIHCFINDKKMVKMDNDQRLNMFNDIDIPKTSSTQDYSHFTKKYRNNFFSETLIHDLENLFHNQVLLKRNLLHSSHKEIFETYIINKMNQNGFSHLIPYIQKSWKSIDNTQSIEDTQKSIVKWDSLTKIENQFTQSKENNLKLSIYIILSLYYPIIDREPTVKRNHLIKLPFSVHPTTEKISLPIDHSLIMDYDTFHSFPSLKSLVQSHDQNALCLFNRGKEILDQWITFYNNV